MHRHFQRTIKMNLISIVVLDTLMSCLEVHFVIITIKNLTSSIGAV